MTTTTKTETRTHADLKVGDVTYVQGYRFEVVEVWRSNATVEVVRFTGKALDANLVGTSYDGGVYGALPEIPCVVEIA